MERLSEDNPLYESLEEIHVFVLAHVLRRPIVVVADLMLKDSSGDALAPIPFGGIYLPLECDPRECHRSPLLLTYDAAHFSALVCMEVDSSSPDMRPKCPAVIPLVDSDFKVLPIHFDVDPGQGFNWARDADDPDKTQHLYLSQEDHLQMLEKYMDTCQVNIPKHDFEYLANSKESVNTNDSDECKSSSGSCESEDSQGTKEKSKVAKQMNTVAKSFGSIGKTMSKKLKKNFGGIGKAMKNMTSGSESPNVRRQRKHSLGGSQTQSTNLSLTLDMLKDKHYILCAKLSNKRAKYQEEMVKNYLHSTRERFECDRDLKKKRGVELRQRAEQKRLRGGGNFEPVACITPGCNMFGTFETSYLCSSCFARQKQEALNFQNSQTVQRDTKSNLVSIAKTTGGDGRTSYGSAKFNEETDDGLHDTVIMGRDISRAGQKNSDLNNRSPSRSDTLHLNKSTFYDGRCSPEIRHLTEDTGTCELVRERLNVPSGKDIQSSHLEVFPNSSRHSWKSDEVDGNVRIPFHHVTTGDKSPTSLRGQPRARSPMPSGYDNLDEQIKSQCTISKPAVQNIGNMNHCQTPGCQFYGNAKFDHLCSGCYKIKAQNMAPKEMYPKHTKL